MERDIVGPDDLNHVDCVVVVDNLVLDDLDVVRNALDRLLVDSRLNHFYY